MYKYLEKFFGNTEDGKPVALTFEQLVEKLNEAKDVKIFNLEDGGFVSKEKLDAKILELNGVKEQLETANGVIQSYKDMDIDGIKSSVSTWEQKYKDDTEALKNQLAEQEQMHSLDMFLGGYQFSSKAAKDGIRADFISKKFPYEEGKFIGAKEYMDGLLADDDYKAAFVSKEPEPAPSPEPTPTPKPHFSDPNPNKPMPKPKVGLAELMRRKNENPNTEVKFD